MKGIFSLVFVLTTAFAWAAEFPAPKEGTWVVRDFRFHTGEVLPELRLHFLAQDLPAGRAAQKLRLVRFDPAHQRLSNKKWTDDIDALNQFSDGYPVLVVSQAALDDLNTRLAALGHAAVTMPRFRPNIVLAGLEAHDEDRVDALHIADV